MSFDACIRPAPDVMIREVGGESVVLDLKTERYLGFDEIATRMWQILTVADSVQAAYESLLAEYEVEAELLRQQLSEFIEELLALNLVQSGAGSPSENLA